MNKSILIGIGVFVFTAVVYWITSISYHNKFNSFENTLEVAIKEVQNVHATTYKNMKMQGVAFDKYGDLVIEAMKVAVSGRQNAGAAMTWIQEKNPNIDSSVLKKLQQVIEVSFNKFKSAQTRQLDIYNKYKTSTTSYFGSHFANSHGFPKKSWEELGRIVTSKVTKRDFATGELSDPEL